MIWVAPLVNLLLWMVYLTSAFGCIYFFFPHFGGWKSLDSTGRICAVGSAIFCLISGICLVTTTVIPW